MSDILRCPKCFGPKDHPDEVCKYCGLDPQEYKSIASFSDGFLRELLEEPLPDDLSLDEKINRIKNRMKRN